MAKTDASAGVAKQPAQVAASGPARVAYERVTAFLFFDAVSWKAGRFGGAPSFAGKIRKRTPLLEVETLSAITSFRHREVAHPNHNDVAAVAAATAERIATRRRTATCFQIDRPSHRVILDESMLSPLPISIHFLNPELGETFSSNSR
ncbi:MAG: hypothetical protein DME97_13055 [Verrucomicrobia bacterium]|nr:MAG: hypothetical protein DME97_13055 [Verrucomicrobiota bacterium]